MSKYVFRNGKRYSENAWMWATWTTEELIAKRNDATRFIRRERRRHTPAAQSLAIALNARQLVCKELNRRRMTALRAAAKGGAS